MSELAGGTTSGFSPYGGPEGITVGPDGRIWFGAFLDPGRIGEVIDGKVSELEGGQAGFTANTAPAGGPCRAGATRAAAPPGRGKVSVPPCRALRGRGPTW